MHFNSILTVKLTQPLTLAESLGGGCEKVTTSNCEHTLNAVSLEPAVP